MPRFLKVCATALALDAVQAMNTGAERKAAKIRIRAASLSDRFLISTPEM